MGVSRLKTKHGIKFRARVSFQGVRHNLGVHKRKYQAEEAVENFYRRNGMDYELQLTPAEKLEKDEADLAAGLKRMQHADIGTIHLKPRQMGFMGRLRQYLSRK